ncbi:MAG: hypothetical protein OHK0039_24950 [Bacteroidia bacterium]
MVIVGLSLALLLVGAGALYLTARLAYRRGRQPGLWVMGTITLWALVWVVEKYSFQWWAMNQGILAQASMRVNFIVAALAACLLAYALVMLRLRQLPPDLHDWEQKVGEIGKEE